MENNTEMIFMDKMVTYDQFVDDLAIKIALKVHMIEKGQLEISQSKAYWRKRSIPTHSERSYPPTFELKNGAKAA